MNTPPTPEYSIFGHIILRSREDIERIGARIADVTEHTGEKYAIEKFHFDDELLRVFKDLVKKAPLLWKESYIWLQCTDCTFEKGADLSYSDLRGLAMMDVDLSYTNLRGSDLRNGDWSRSIFIGADMRDTILQHIWLTKNDMRGANLSRSDMRSTALLETDLSGAILINADLRNAVMSDTDFSRADLTDADLRHSCLGDSDVSWSSIVTSFSVSTIFVGIIWGMLYPFGIIGNYKVFVGIVFIITALLSIRLMCVTLKMANFRGAHMMRANLKEATGIKGRKFWFKMKGAFVD